MFQLFLSKSFTALWAGSSGNPYTDRTQCMENDRLYDTGGSGRTAPEIAHGMHQCRATVAHLNSSNFLYVWV